MKILIFENNLFWSIRLKNKIKTLSYEVEIIDKWKEELPVHEIAILNLGSMIFPPEKLIPKLINLKVKTLAHAGHKEKDLLELGKSLGCHMVVTNSMIINKIDNILAQMIAM